MIRRNSQEGISTHFIDVMSRLDLSYDLANICYAFADCHRFGFYVLDT